MFLSKHTAERGASQGLVDVGKRFINSVIRKCDLVTSVAIKTKCRIVLSWCNDQDVEVLETFKRQSVESRPRILYDDGSSKEWTVPTRSRDLSRPVQYRSWPEQYPSLALGMSGCRIWNPAGVHPRGTCC